MPPKYPQKPSKDATFNRRAVEDADYLELGQDENSEGDEEEGQQEQQQQEEDERPQPKIPPELLTKLVKNFFEDEGTKVSGAATKTVGEYMHLLLTEAVYRAVSNRRGGDPWARAMNSGMMLEVEDLEKITPQLLLDF